MNKHFQHKSHNIFIMYNIVWRIITILSILGTTLIETLTLSVVLCCQCLDAQHL